MVARLRQASEKGSAFAGKLLQTIAVKSPTSVAIAFEQMRRGAGLDFAEAMRTGGGLRMTATNARHISPPGQAARFEATRAPDSETTLDGNSVVVEEQMLKMAESRMAYDAAIGFYQKSMQMIRMAAKKPGAG